MQKIFLSLLTTALMITSFPSRAQNQEEKVNLSEDFKKHFDKYDVEGSFVVYDLKNEKAYYFNEERCNIQYTPASTFKIFNSLVGLETGAIPDTSHIIPWDGIQRGSYTPWHRDNSLKTAFKYSVVWYYQELARRVGEKEMQRLIDLNSYGNQNINGGIDAFWLTGDLRISQNQQIEFLKKLYNETLNFSKKNQKLVKDIMLMESNEDYRLFAKTGMGKQGSVWYGWYVGWIEKDTESYFFATNMETADSKKILTGGRKGITLAVLADLGFIKKER